MGLARAFESDDAPADARVKIEALRAHLAATGTTPTARARGPADGGDIPLHDTLAPLVPGGVLPRGSVVAVPPRHRIPTAGGNIDYLTLAILAGASARGAWVGVVGVPNLGIRAVSDLGADLSRFLLVDEPGERWPDAVAVLAGAVDVVLLHAPRRPTAAQLRRITNRVRVTDRQRGCVLLVTSPWEQAHLSLDVRNPQWEGLGNGAGNLGGRRVTVTASGRGVHGRERSVELWLPAVDGNIAEYVPGAGRLPEDTGRPRLRIA